MKRRREKSNATRSFSSRVIREPLESVRQENGSLTAECCGVSHNDVVYRVLSASSCGVSVLDAEERRFPGMAILRFAMQLSG